MAKYEMLNEVDHRSIPGNHSIASMIPVRLPDSLTESDKTLLQRHRNKQDIIHTLVLRLLAFIRENPIYIQRGHYTAALTLALSLAFRPEEEAEAIEEEKASVLLPKPERASMEVATHE